jgi:2-dehydro-3-deoxy-L-rhamnonate dehydrogenase (NAD+)
MNVLVSGGASGLGAAVVAELQRGGDRAFVLDKQAPAVEVAGFHLVDVSGSAATGDAVRDLAEHAGSNAGSNGGPNGGLDAVVTAAGTDSCGPLGSVPTPDWERVVQVNLFGTVAVIRAALPYLERSHGRVVTVASTLGLRVAGDATAYCASKFGVVGFTRALALELAGRVGVTLVVPGGMNTRFFDGRDEQYRPPDESKLSPPEYVAAGIVYALRQPAGFELRELVMCHEEEPSWP